MCVCVGEMVVLSRSSDDSNDVILKKNMNS